MRSQNGLLILLLEKDTLLKNMEIVAVFIEFSQRLVILFPSPGRLLSPWSWLLVRVAEASTAARVATTSAVVAACANEQLLKAARRGLS